MLQPVVVTIPGVQTTGTAPHSLEAVTPVEHTGRVGLQPRAPPAGTLANTGAVATVHVNVAEHVLVNPQAVAV